jgi:hypothetical protein
VRAGSRRTRLKAISGEAFLIEEGELPGLEKRIETNDTGTD